MPLKRYRHYECVLVVSILPILEQYRAANDMMSLWRRSLILSVGPMNRHHAGVLSYSVLEEWIVIMKAFSHTQCRRNSGPLQRSKWHVYRIHNCTQYETLSQITCLPTAVVAVSCLVAPGVLLLLIQLFLIELLCCCCPVLTVDSAAAASVAHTATQAVQHVIHFEVVADVAWQYSLLMQS